MSRFGIASAVEPDAGGYAATIDADWTIGGRPNGGYLMATMGRAAAHAHPEHPDVLAAGVTYVAAPEPGPVAITVATLRAGRSASQAQVELHQDGTLCVTALLTLGRLETVDASASFDSTPPPEVAPIERCWRLPPVGPGGFPAPVMGQVRIDLDPADTGFVAGPDGNHRLRGWLSMIDEDADTIALLYAVDAFPPATFGLGSTGWVPTLQLTAYVRAVPAPGPLRVLQEVGLVAGRRVDEVCRVWDSRGRLVAQGSQLAAVRFGPDGPARRQPA